MKNANVIHLADKKQQQNQLLERLLLEHGEALERFLRMRLALQQDKDDIIQDVLLRMVRISELEEKLQEPADKVRSYLFKVASNLIIDGFRKQQYRDSYSQQLSEQDNTTQSPETVLSQRQSLEQVEEAMSEVKAKHRRAFLMNRLDNMSYRQISEEMGISVSSVERYISSVLVAIREKIEFK